MIHKAMKKTFSRVCVVAVACLAFSTMGCTIHQMCERLRECDCRPGSWTVESCEDVTNECVDELDDDAADEWEELIEACLQHDSCDVYCACYAGVPSC